MATGFRYLPSVGKNYNEQGEIYFACQNYARQDAATRAKIERLLDEAGGGHAAALRRYLCTRASWEQVTAEYYVSAATLDRARRRFYELW